MSRASEPRHEFHQQLECMVEGLRAGDEKVIRAWYAHVRRPLTSFILARVSNKSDVEEIFHDTCLSILESVGLFSAKSSFWGWMCSIARHEVADFYRRAYAKRMILALPFADAVFVEQIPDMHKVAGEVEEVVRSSLAKLSHEDRELLALKYLDKNSVKEIAVRLRLSFKSTESRLFRARKAFIAAYEANST